MITNILKTIVLAKKTVGNLPLALDTDTTYYFKAYIGFTKIRSKKELECVLKIINLYQETQVIEHRFFNREIYQFSTKNFSPFTEDTIACKLTYNLPNYNEKTLLYLEINYIKDYMIDNLKTSKKKRKNSI